MQRKVMLSFALVGVLMANDNIDLKALDSVTVTAQRSSQNMDQISKSISAINKETIERKIGTSVPSLINEAPGVSMVNEGIDSGTINVRGFSSSDYRVPMFIDGLRFRGRPAFEYSIFSPEQIERIEIIRGPASTAAGKKTYFDYEISLSGGKNIANFNGFRIINKEEIIAQNPDIILLSNFDNLTPVRSIISLKNNIK